MIKKTTIDLVLDKRVKPRHGKYPVKIRVTNNRLPRLFTLKNAEFWVKEVEFKSILNNSAIGKLKDVGLDLMEELVRARNITKDLKVFNFDDFKELWEGKKVTLLEMNLVEAFNWRIDRLKKQERYTSAEVAISSRNSLSNYFKPNKSLTNLTGKDLTGYLEFMRSKGCSISTVGMYTRDLRRLYNELIEENLLPPEYYPFGKREFRIPSGRKMKTALNINDIRKILKYVPDETSKEALCIDLWLFSYLCNGMNLMDIANLKYKNIKGDFMYFVRQKTSRKYLTEKIIKVALIPSAKEIVERRGNLERRDTQYVFPIKTDKTSPSNERQVVNNIAKQINVHMKRLAVKLDLSKKDISGISARDAFATISLQLGRPLSDISESLGHSDISVTQHYLAQLVDEEKMAWQAKLI